MSISINVPDGPLTPKDRMQQLLMSAEEGHSRRVEERIKALLENGITRDRISIVTHAGCPDCHGTGVFATEKSDAGSVSVTLTPCNTCPGICVDGKPIPRMGRL